MTTGENRPSIGAGGDGFIAIDRKAARWSAPTANALLVKLDAAGIGRDRLRLEKWTDGDHDHALSPKAVAEFEAALESRNQ